MKRLDKTLAGRPHDSNFCCLLVHHPPLPGMIGRRKALSDAKELEFILQKHPVDLILHGHNHRNTSSTLGSTRIFSTNSASSVVVGRSAAYRVFDVERSANAWSVSMQLKQLANGSAIPSTVATEAWETDRQND